MPTANILKPQVDETHDTQIGLILGPKHFVSKTLTAQQSFSSGFQCHLAPVTKNSWAPSSHLSSSYAPACHPALAQPSTTQHVGKEGSRRPLLAGITSHLVLAQWLHAVPHCWHWASAAGSCYLPLLQPHENATPHCGVASAPRSNTAGISAGKENAWSCAFLPLTCSVR